MENCIAKNTNIPEAPQYIRDFENMGFGLFVHFGLYSHIGQGEWVARLGDPEKMPFCDETEYKKLMNAFNPKSMENIVVAAKVAGAKYITLTTRHHDGFSLFDTCGLSTYDSVHALAGRDLVREFVDACRKYDMVPFFYHTIFEYWHPDLKVNFKKYLEYLRESVKLLCTNYGKIGGLWFDGVWAKSDAWDTNFEGDVWEQDKLYKMIRKYQPEAMIINNTGLSKLGETGHPELDSVTFERGKAFPMNREGMHKYVAAEVCDSVNMHWGIANDFNFKSPKTLIERLCQCRKVGANFLLNVGPNADGTIPEYPMATLNLLGEWLNIFGEAIYETKPLWWEAEKNFALQNGDDVYLFCHDLCRKGSADVTYMSGTEGGYDFDHFPYALENVHWMDNGEVLKSSYADGKLTVHFTGYPYGTDYCVRVAKATIVR